MALLLGIDTGGTYTDAVLLDDDQGVIAFAKSLTTKRDLALGIGRAVDAVLPSPLPEIHLVSLSTTLATNAVVEGQGCPICLLLVGYPPDAMDREGLRRALGSDPVVFIAGGHTVSGEEQMPLDLDGARKAIEMHAATTAAFAVSGYFGVYNPSHELTVSSLIRELTGKPVTCGHELSSHLNAPRRAITAVLNARLVPMLSQLILAVQDILSAKNIHAHLMVVKGDGSLIEARLALEHPVETILSGPAASVVGARYLSGMDDVFVADMGGTTTDIALLKAGNPVLNEDGATVGGWKTMVEAVSVHTTGLGGDSRVAWDRSGNMVLGPVRIVPLSLLAHQYPDVLTVLRQHVSRDAIKPHDGHFALLQRPLEGARRTLSASQVKVWEALATGPVALTDLFLDSEVAMLTSCALEYLVDCGLVVISGFTPTDAAHVLGCDQEWSVEGARLGAEIWARHAGAYNTGVCMQARAFCLEVMEQMTVQIGRAVVAAALAKGHQLNLDARGSLGRLLVDQALTGKEADTLMEVALTIRRPLVAIGAPVHTYYPAVAGRLHARLHIPEHAGIANAVGAVAGSVIQTVRAYIKPLGEGFRVHLPIGIQDFNTRAEALDYAMEKSRGLADARARRAGASTVQVRIGRKDHVVDASGTQGEGFFLGTEINATATGRPRLKSECTRKEEKEE
jgi:N-methylhydantoinase A/oxoprolinase/acetone carboxylase beta subunit